jgi:hypothetical protein
MRQKQAAFGVAQDQHMQSDSDEAQSVSDEEY